jgi:4-carboxymuconolactone decarboxylase
VSRNGNQETEGEKTLPDPDVDLTLRSSSDTDGEVQRVLAQMEEGKTNLKIIRLMANAPHAFRPFVLFSKALMREGFLPDEDREAIVLYLAVRNKVPYEWNEHLPMALAAGLTQEQIESLASESVDGLSRNQQLAVEVAKEVADGFGIAPNTWRRACNVWGQEGAMDAMLSVAWWGGLVPTIVRALGIVTPEVQVEG